MERLTRQHHAVLDALAQCGQALSPQDLLEHAKSAVPSLNLSTVYRQLKGLQQAGQIVRVELPGQPARFEIAALEATATATATTTAPRAVAASNRLNTAPSSPGLGLDAHAKKQSAMSAKGRFADADADTLTDMRTDTRTDTQSAIARTGQRGRGHGENSNNSSNHHDHHHHFLCVQCDRVYPIHACPGSMNDLAPPGFEVQHHDLTLRGRCAGCATGSAT